MRQDVDFIGITEGGYENVFCFMERKCWLSTIQSEIGTNLSGGSSVLVLTNRSAQILHRVVEKQQLFDSVFVDSMAEGISADTKKPSSLDLVIASLFERSFDQASLDSIEYAGMDILS